MMYLIVDIKALESFKIKQGHAIQPVKTKSGEWILRDSILTDSKTFGSDLVDYLKTCKQKEFSEEDFPQIELTMDDFSKPQMP